MSTSLVRKIAAGVAGTALAIGMAAAPASASVTFDPATGTGFVGKGDVQLAFGWNNQTLQTNASGIAFSYNNVATYSATCTWVTGEGTRGEQTHNVDIPRETSVNAEIAFETRKNNQSMITGFNLNGFGETTTEGTIPIVGDACVGNPDGVAHDGTWSEVTLVRSSDGGLYVNYDGASVLLPITPVV